MIPMRKLLEKLLMRFRYRTMVRLHNHELRHCTLSLQQQDWGGCLVQYLEFWMTITPEHSRSARTIVDSVLGYLSSWSSPSPSHIHFVDNWVIWGGDSKKFGANNLNLLGLGQVRLCDVNCYVICAAMSIISVISTAPQITPLSTQFMIDRGGILKLDIYMCWLVPLRPTAVPLNSGCGWGKLESSLSFAFHILRKKYDTRKYNILFSHFHGNLFCELRSWNHFSNTAPNPKRNKFV